MAKTSYTVAYGPTMWECTIVIDDNAFTERNIKEMVRFWEGWQHRLAENKGDYTATFLQQLARKICYLLVQHGGDLDDLIKKFEGEEGWDKVDGSTGIEIVEIDSFEMYTHEFEVLPGNPIA